jgi:hypothetical protein
MFDRDNSGAIEFNEFMALWKYIMDWEKTFRSYDKDNSGGIDKEELQIGKKRQHTCQYKWLSFLVRIP